MKTIEFFLILILVCIITGSMVNEFANPDCNDKGEEKLIDWIKCKEKRT